MGFLKRVLGSGGDSDGEESLPGPGWAQPMSQAETDALVAAVGADLSRRGLEHTIGDGVVTIERSGTRDEYGLSNLAQLCHQIERNEWTAAITSHFDNSFAGADAQAEVRELARDFERVRSMLKVRLYPGSNLGGMDPRPPASWELAPSITAAFVYDLPTTVLTADPDQVTAWGKSRDEILEIAVDNVRGDAVDAQPMSPGASGATALVGDHFFAASHLFVLDERLPPEAQGHAVFAVPHRHALLYAPMVDMGVVQSIQRVIVTAVSMFQQGPGSISPGLYWWRAGTVTLLPAQFDGRDVQFAPPDEFVQALNTLPAPSG